jgi:DNA repair photolyase
MLEVCLELGFPIPVLERSPLVLRDVGLLKETNHRAPYVVSFTLIASPDSSSYEGVRRTESQAPAMGKISKAGILTGACMMPILAEW